MNKKKLAIALSSFLLATTVYAGGVGGDFGKCKDAKILTGSMISDTPWNAMFPIKLAGFNISPSGSGAPSHSSHKSICSCQDDLGLFVPGFTQSMFEPARIIELVREPDCMMTLGGAKLKMTNGRQRGTTGSNEQGEGQGAQAAFWHYHYFAYPLLLMLEMFTPNRCGDGYVSMDLLYFSELDPTYSDPELSFFANPESAIFANPISIAACLADTVASTVGEPLDSLFWCAGAWGEMYPLNGYVKNKSSMAAKTSLLATRAVASLHRRLLARQTMGDSALCSAPLFPTIPKTQYKMSMMYPVAERKSAHRVGQTALTWGEWRNIPSKEDAIYMLWRWNDCCTTYY